jgi:TolB-like protein/cytochrome c-type biogenesis protein CcmH/NrfG
LSAISHAVFLSYASQDAEAARRICEALRAAGIEVWFDQSELRGGDAWDQKIRREIRDCSLFLPLISANTASRREGYFRLEWDIADQRTHMMARDRAFIVPVCLDATPGAGTDVPDSFHRVQWTRLPGGETPSEFVTRIARLLSPAPATTARLSAGAASGAETPLPMSGRSRLKRALPVMVAVLLVAAIAYGLADKVWNALRGTTAPPVVSSPVVSSTPAATTTPSSATATFAPPPHSIAVLPFVNMSGDKDQEYFSDGLTEELLNSLARINELQVAGRRSSFYFKGKDVELGTIAHKLNVGAVLEGSVRRSGHTVRITAELINAVTGFQLWSHTYDRNLGDVLKLQTEIADAVTSALKVTLLTDVVAKIVLGGTRNPAAFDAYLRAEKARSSVAQGKDDQTAIAAYAEAIRLDPNYALAFAGRSQAYSNYAGRYASAAAIRENFDKAQADAREAIRLAPELAEGYLALGTFFELGSLDFTQAGVAYERALALAPGNATVVRTSSAFLADMGRFDAAISGAHRAVALDPLDRRTHDVLGYTLYFARRYKDALAAWAESLSLDPSFSVTYAGRGFAYYQLGDLESARASCERATYPFSPWCLALVYHKLGRHADAEAELAKLKGALGDASAYQCATIYAQWGNGTEALKWLATAMRLRDTGLLSLKTDPLMDPLRQEPRFLAVMRELKFPN